MSVKEYISQRFRSFGITLSEAELLDVCLSASIGIDDEVSSDNYERVNVGIANLIPPMLMRATSINESGFSMSWNTEGLKDYYTFLCKQYGIEDKLDSTRPKVKFL